jgi:hypothetical protein
MKPTSITARSRRRFPVTDCNYQPITLDQYRGRCTKTEPPPFREISRQYFQNDARRDFLIEAFSFAVIIITAAMPFVSAAYAIGELCQAFGHL